MFEALKTIYLGKHGLFLFAKLILDLSLLLEHKVAFGMIHGNADDDDLNESNASGSEDLEGSPRSTQNAQSQGADSAAIARQRHLVQYLKVFSEFETRECRYVSLFIECASLRRAAIGGPTSSIGDASSAANERRP